ncbi:MAG: response regulator [bacterium]
MSHKVLFVDDEPNVTHALKRSLRNEPYEILSANSAKEALEIIKSHNLDVVISDEMMPDMTGSKFLAIVHKQYPDTIRMILTGHANLDSAVRAINEAGVYRFFTKPCNEIDLAITIRQAIQQKDLMAETKRLLKIVQKQQCFIEEMEKRYPGIADLKEDASGAIIMEDSDEDLDKIIDQINNLV